MIKMIVFDMAGTTVNENNVVYKTLQNAINQAGYNFTLEQVLAEGAGREKLQAIKNILHIYAHENNDQLAEKIYKSFILKLAYDELEITQQDNAEELFRALKQMGILVVLNTGYNAETANSLLNKLNWKIGKEIDGLITASDVKNNRPKPDMIWLAMERFGITDAAEVIKIGDSNIDIEEGRNAGCGLNIGITTGAHNHQQLRMARPDYIIDNLNELLSILDNAII